VFVRAVLEGRAPFSATRDGFEWAEDIAAKTDEGIADVRRQIEELRIRVDAIIGYLADE
jgi:hypothetical protein